MAIPTPIFYFFTFQIFILVTNVKAGPHMEVHPSEISLGLSSSLDINCSFSLIDHPEMAAFATLILSRANSSGETFQNLAAITQFSPDAVTVLTPEKFSATGVHSQTGQSFLHLNWEVPTAMQGGVYRCTARGLGTLGQPVESVNTSAVTVVDEASLYHDVFEKLNHMEIRVMAMENKVSDMEHKNSEMENNINIADLAKRIEALENYNSQMSSYITNLEDTVATLQRFQPMYYIGTFENHDYYVSKEGYGEINNVINVCKSYGGYLVEIDSENEFNAFREFLANTSVSPSFHDAVIAGTDEAEDGTWVFPSSNKLLPFTSWFGGVCTPHDLNCLSLNEFASWSMVCIPCNKDPPHINSRFTCEIPRV